MKQPIVGYHKDNEGHWVAKLHCGHNQHVRHDPPWSVRDWTQTADGRKSMIGFELNCVKCDEGEPVDWSYCEDAVELAKKVVQSNRVNTILYCQNWLKTVVFYRDLLKFPIHFENDWFMEFQLTADAFLSIANSERASIQASGGQGITLSLKLNDLSDAKRAIEAADIATTEIKTNWGAETFCIYDPEGHRIEFWQAASTDKIQ